MARGTELPSDWTTRVQLGRVALAFSLPFLLCLWKAEVLSVSLFFFASRASESQGKKEEVKGLLVFRVCLKKVLYFIEQKLTAACSLALFFSDMLEAPNVRVQTFAVPSEGGGGGICGGRCLCG